MADDDRPRGSCVIPDCPRDPYRREDGTLPIVCGPDVSRARHWLIEIPGYAAELGRQLTDASRPDPRGKDISILLPSMATSAPRSGGRVSGSAEPRLPIAPDVVDLLGPRRPLMAQPAYRSDDQQGFDSIWSMLSFWCRDLAEHRGLGERGRRPGEESPIPWLADWLVERLDKAAEDWPLFAEFFSDMRRIHGALRALLGLVEPPEFKRGVPCPKCQILSALVRLDTVPDEPDRISCSACGALLTIPEYEEYTTMLSATLTAEGREAAKRAAADRRAVVRLLREMHAVGWRHTAGAVGHRDPDTGVLDVEAVRHIWRRGGEEIEAFVWLVPAHERTDLRYGTAEATTDGWIGSAWLASMDGRQLHRIASAAGVLSVPKEQTA